MNSSGMYRMYVPRIRVLLTILFTLFTAQGEEASYEEL